MRYAATFAIRVMTLANGLLAAAAGSVLCLYSGAAVRSIYTVTLLIAVSTTGTVLLGGTIVSSLLSTNLFCSCSGVGDTTVSLYHC